MSYHYSIQYSVADLIVVLRISQWNVGRKSGTITGVSTVFSITTAQVFTNLNAQVRLFHDALPKKKINKQSFCIQKTTNTLFHLSTFNWIASSLTPSSSNLQSISKCYLLLTNSPVLHYTHCYCTTYISKDKNASFCISIYNFYLFHSHS